LVWLWRWLDAPAALSAPTLQCSIVGIWIKDLFAVSSRAAPVLLAQCARYSEMIAVAFCVGTVPIVGILIMDLIAFPSRAAPVLFAHVPAAARG